MADEDNGSEGQQTSSDTPRTHGTETVLGTKDKITNGQK